MYGRDTFIRLASSVCDTPSSFILSRMRRRNAEPTLSIAFIPFNQPSRHPQFLQPTLLTSRRTDLDPALSHPGLILSFTSDIQSSLSLLPSLHPITPHQGNTSPSSKWCWCMSSQKRICTCSARAILSVAKFQQDIFDNVAITHQLKAVFRI